MECCYITQPWQLSLIRSSIQRFSSRGEASLHAPNVRKKTCEQKADAAVCQLGSSGPVWLIQQGPFCAGIRIFPNVCYVRLSERESGLPALPFSGIASENPQNAFALGSQATSAVSRFQLLLNCAQNILCLDQNWKRFFSCVEKRRGGVYGFEWLQCDGSLSLRGWEAEEECFVSRDWPDGAEEQEGEWTGTRIPAQRASFLSDESCVRRKKKTKKKEQHSCFLLGDKSLEGKCEWALLHTRSNKLIDLRYVQSYRAAQSSIIGILLTFLFFNTYALILYLKCIGGFFVYLILPLLEIRACLLFFSASLIVSDASAPSCRRKRDCVICDSKRLASLS